MEHKDKFMRPLKEGDICFRLKSYSVGKITISKVIPIKIEYFTEQKVNIARNTFVDSKNLILASPHGLGLIIGKDNEEIT